MDITKDGSVLQLPAAMVALVDDFTMHVDPLLAKRLPAPMNPINPQDYGSGTLISLARRPRKLKTRMMRPRKTPALWQ